MKTFKHISWTAVLVILFASCRKNETLTLQPTLGLGGDSIIATSIDKWITDSLTTPYNISAKYRWDPWNASLFRTLTPPDEARVIPLFSALRRVWINPYNDETGSTLFMKKFSPKQFVLIGSVEYAAYSVTLGQAEGGNNIVFFDVNQNFDKNPVTSIKRVIHTAHHEFAHILHQTIIYPLDFKNTSQKLGLAGYTATWFNITDAEALAEGYATSYSMSGPDDDFVETVSTMLTDGKKLWDERKASTNAVAMAALQQKEDFVVTYFRQVWNIDFYRLQTRVQTALYQLYPPSSVTDLYGFGKSYTTASTSVLNPTLLPNSAGFNTIYNTAKTGLAAVGGAGRVLDSIAIVNTSTNGASLRVYYHNSAGTNLIANWQYVVTKDGSNVYTFGASGIADGNASVIATGVTALLTYFNGNKFTVEWHANAEESLYPRVKYVPLATPASFFIATLKP